MASIKVIEVTHEQAANWGIVQEVRDNAIMETNVKMQAEGIDPVTIKYLKGTFYISADSEYGTMLMMKHAVTVRDMPYFVS